LTALRRLVLAAVAVALLAPASVAHASTSQESLFQDDGSLLFSTYQRRQSTLDELKALGVDTIRANLLWNWVAPAPNSKRRPAGFDATDPAAYDWFRFDELARGAAARGIVLQWTITGPIPSWASDCNSPVSLRHICRPNAREFGNFVKAVGRHYSGSFAGIPRVSRWSLWNEPNQAGWLYPQTEAPGLYRALAYAGIAALRATGHAHDQILLGETSPLGRHTGTKAKRNMPPAAFWRGLFCIDTRGHKTTKSSACRHFKQLRATGVAHHPYTRGAGGSPISVVGRDDVTLASIGRLETVIDQARRQRRIPSRLPIYLTEYGVQTNPPDRDAGVSPSLAATWLNQADWMAYNDPRIRSVAQYELLDERPLGGFQTGLRTYKGRAKPTLAAYRLPIWPVYKRGRTTVWGQVRPGGRGAKVNVSYQSKRGSHWRTLKTVRVSSSHGFFRLVTSRRAYRWRLGWKGPSGHTQVSRTAAPAAR
jgi:hypothetical protein